MWLPWEINQSRSHSGATFAAARQAVDLTVKAVRRTAKAKVQ